MHIMKDVGCVNQVADKAVFGNILFLFRRYSFYLMFLLLLVTLFSYSANGQVFADFETPENAPAVSNGNAAIVDNPFKEGINTSAKCLKYNKASGNWHYVSMQFSEPKSFGSSTVMTFKVHSSTVGRVYYKFWNGSSVVIESWAHEYGNMPPANEWVELTMDVSSAAGKEFTELQIAVGVDNEAEATAYLDDFKFTNPLAEEGIPVLNLSISPAIIYTGSPVTFDASASFDWNDLGLTYDWDFGDGTELAGTSIEEHSYVQSGFYTSTLKLTNTDGKSVSKSTSHFVFNQDDIFSRLEFWEGTPKVNNKIEGVFQINRIYENPYNPDTVAVDAVITKPDNSKDTVPCFYYVRSMPVNGKWENDSTFQCWMVRFNSEQAGEHQVKLHLKDKSGEFTSEEVAILVVPSDKKGMVYMDAAHRQYYRHSTGEPYLPIGENVAWSNKSDKIADYHDHLTTLGENNANMLRYWTVTFASQSLEARNGYSYYKGIGNYSQQAAGLLDSVFNIAREQDIQIMLAIWQHGILSENVNPNWDLNPYNTANGGFLSKPADFFNDEYAKYLTRNLLRYYVARWGYSTHLHSWEFFNEVDLTGNTTSNPPTWVADVDDWHEEMGEYLRKIDPYDHIITTSLSGWMDHPLAAALGDNKHLDLLQFHSYDNDVAGGILAKFNKLRSKTELPIMCGEFGKSGLAETGDEVRRACWVGYMNNLPNLHWYWDKAIQQGWYSVYAPMAAYFEPLDLAAEGNPDPISIPVKHADSDLFAAGLKTDASNYYIYVYHKAFQTGINGAVLALEDIPFGNYKITWFDPLTGTASEPETTVLINQYVDIPLPDFSMEIALKLEFLSDYNHPIANAGRNQVLPTGATMHISGENSTNPKGLSITYAWTLISQPEGSSITISDPSAVSFSLVSEIPGNYLFELVVSDAEESSLADTLIVTISAPPVAVAGDDINAVIGTNVVLDGSASYDVEGEVLSYLWTMVSKPDGSIADLKKQSFVDPVFKPDLPGDYMVILVVNDGLQDSEPDTIVVKAVTTGLNDLFTDEYFRVYPNPASDFIIIEAVQGFREELHLELTDLSGNLIMSKPYGKNIPAGDQKVLTLPAYLPGGMYLLRITAKNPAFLKVFKIVQ
jgi:PKD repeat protein